MKPVIAVANDKATMIFAPICGGGGEHIVLKNERNISEINIKKGL
jgi:hypothetical protein